MSIEDDLSNKINGYLGVGSDYAFELKCVDRLRKIDSCHVDWVHNGTYIDDLTGKQREFDIRAHVWPHKSMNHIMHVPIECKNLSEESPLIIHCSARESASAYIESIRNEYRDPQIDYSLNGAGYKIERHPPGPNPYEVNEFVGKSLERIKWVQNSQVKSSDAEIYDRWSQALSSAHEMIDEACGAQPEHLSQHKQHSVHYLIPVLVIPKGTLWVAKYNEMGELVGNAEQVDEASYFVERVYKLGSEKFTCSHLHFVTENHLAEFLWSRLNDLAV